MPQAVWPLLKGRPRIEVVLPLPAGGGALTLDLLADTGAGSLKAPFELLINDNECRLCGGQFLRPAVLGRAYRGSYPTYAIRVRLPGLGFDHTVIVAGITSPPAGFGGLAGFRFLNRFTYGNFGDPGRFGLES